MAKLFIWISACWLLFSIPGKAQRPVGWELDKMPADLETELALRALPPHLRGGATVYLLDPTKGYYVARKGTNGFVCFIDRTDWEWGEFRKDVYAPISYDAEGARTIFQSCLDVAAMRATGKFTALQIRDSVIARIRRGTYRAPARAGVSYMVAPIMRVYTGNPGDNTVMTMSMPHCMFYAPYVTGSDLGIANDFPNGPALVNPGGTLLGAKKGPFGYVIMPLNNEATAKIRADGKDLLKRLAAYSPYFKLDGGEMHH